MHAFLFLPPPSLLPFVFFCRECPDFFKEIGQDSEVLTLLPIVEISACVAPKFSDSFSIFFEFILLLLLLLLQLTRTTAAATTTTNVALAFSIAFFVCAWFVVIYVDILHTIFVVS